MLPTSLSAPHRWTSKLPEFARRAIHHDQMELDSAVSQMWSLITNPSLVSKISKARKMTKNHYHRDDPAFLVLQVFFLAIATIATGLALDARIFRIVYNIVYQIGISYFTVGALAATVSWMFANRFLMGSGHLHEVRREVDWQHSFDIHCNSYFPFFIYTHVLQFVLLPVLMQEHFIAQLLSNALYAIAVTSYCYNTFRGYLELPMLVKQQLFMYPAVGATSLLALATLTTNMNMTRWTLGSSWPLE